MTTLEIKKANGQFQYRIVVNGKQQIPWQYGTFDADSTIAQAKGRFSLSGAQILDVTECRVDVMNRDGSFTIVTMTRDCFERTKAIITGYSADCFMGRIIEEGGIPVVSTDPF